MTVRTVGLQTGAHAIVEHVEFLHLREDVDEQEGMALVEKLWSMQYMAPGVICASAGRNESGSERSSW